MKYFILIYLSLFLSLQAHSSDHFLHPRSSLFFKNLGVTGLTKETIEKEKDRLERMKQFEVIEAVYGRAKAHFTPEPARPNSYEELERVRSLDKILFPPEHSSLKEPEPVPTLIDLAIEQNKDTDKLEVVKFLIDDGAVVSVDNILKAMKHPQSFEIFKLLIDKYKGDSSVIFFKINYSNLAISHIGDVLKVLIDSIDNWNEKELKRYAHFLVNISTTIHEAETSLYIDLLEKITSAIENKTSESFTSFLIEKYSSHKNSQFLKLIGRLIPRLSIGQIEELKNNPKAQEVLSNLDLSKIVQEAELCSNRFSIPANNTIH